MVQTFVRFACSSDCACVRVGAIHTNTHYTRKHTHTQRIMHSLSLTHTHTRTHTHTQTHTNTHTRTHTHAHTHIHTNTRTHSRTYAHKLTHTHKHTLTPMLIGFPGVFFWIRICILCLPLLRGILLSSRNSPFAAVTRAELWSIRTSCRDHRPHTGPITAGRDAILADVGLCQRQCDCNNNEGQSARYELTTMSSAIISSPISQESVEFLNLPRPDVTFGRTPPGGLKKGERNQKLKLIIQTLTPSTTKIHTHHPKEHSRVQGPLRECRAFPGYPIPAQCDLNWVD